MYRIESDIPPPKLRRKNKELCKEHYLFPFHEMKVGDSFELPVQQGALCRSAISDYSSRLGMGFTVRIYTNTTFRCWRIS